jgi:hypothetical protein
MNRTRTNDGRFQECGSYYAFGNLQDYSCITHGPYESVFDTVGERETSNVFDLVRTFTHFPTITGAGEFVGYPMQYHPGPDDPRGAWPAYNLADKNALAWEILAKTNPSLPVVNVPAYLGELKDIPGTMRGWGRSLLRDVAAGYIQWRWAVRPLVKDLANLYNFQRSVNNRMMELYALRDGRTLKRRCHLVRDSSVTTTNVQLHGIRFVLRALRSVAMTTNSWGTAEWKLLPDSKLPTLGYAPLEGLARRSAAGITSAGALQAAWELTPWSWLVDWFSNVGTCLNACDNSLGLTFGRISLMRTSTSESIYTKLGAVPSQYQLSGWYVEEMTRKERYPVFPVIPVPLPTLPLLTGRQLSILGALAVLKAHKP